MSLPRRRVISDLILVVLAFYVGLQIIAKKGFYTKLSDWIPLSHNASLLLGIVVIFGGLWFLYFAIKNLRQSHRR